MKKLHVLSLILLLSSYAQAVDVQTPFVAESINSVLSDSGHNTNLQKFVLINHPVNYTLDSSTLSLPIDSTLASNLEFVGPTIYDSATSFDICESLPSLTLTNIQFDYLESLKFNSLKLILSSTNNFLNASNTIQISFQSCCIYQQDWDTTLSFKAAFSNGSSLMISDSLFFFQADSPWNMRIGNISDVKFANTIFYYDLKTFTADCSSSFGVSEFLLISVNLSSTFSMTNITVSTKSPTFTNFNAIKGLIDIKNTQQVVFSTVNILQMSTYTESCSWFSIQNSSDVTLQDISILNTTILTQDDKKSLIEIHKVAQTLQLSGLRIQNTFFYGSSDHNTTDSVIFLSETSNLVASNLTIERSGLYSTAVLNIGKSSGLGIISDAKILSSTLNYGDLYCYIGDFPYATFNQNNSLTMQNISVANSKIDGELVTIAMKAEQEITDQAMSIQLSFRDIIFNHNTINDSNLFTVTNNLQDFNSYSTVELCSLNISNITYFNNTIGFGFEGVRITEVNLFYTIGYSAFLSNINMTLNNLTNASMLTVGKGVSTYVLNSSNFMENRFIESVITRLMKSTILISLPIVIINDTSYQAMFYRYGIISGNNISNNSFHYGSAVFSGFQPFRLVESNFFGGNTMISAPVYSSQSRFTIQYPLLRDKDTENFILSRVSSRVASTLNSTFDESVARYAKHLPFLRITSNNFTSLQMTGETIIDALNFEEETAFIQIDNNSFQQIASYQSYLFDGYSVGLMIINNNRFWRVTGNKELFDVNTYTRRSSSLVVVSNELVECQGSGFVAYDSLYSTRVLVQNNTITLNKIGRTVFGLLIQNWDGNIEFNSSSVKNNLFYSLFATQMNFLDIQVPRPYEGATFTMSNDLFISNDFVENIPFVDRMYQNNFMHLGLANATSYFRNTTVDGLGIQWDDNLIRIASGAIFFQQCIFNNISNYDEEGIIFTVTQELTVESSIFTNILGDLKETYGSVFYIARDPYFNASVDVAIRNTTFRNITSFQGSVLMANRISLNLTASNNTFIDNRQLMGGVFYITNSYLEHFDVNNFSLDITGNSAEYNDSKFNFNFIGFRNCSGSANVSSGIMLIAPSLTTIFTVKDSDNLQFNASGLYLTADPVRTLSINQSRMISLLHTDTGNISFNNVTVTNLTNFDTPFMYFECNKDTTILFHGQKINATGLTLTNSSSSSPNAALGVITITGNNGFLNLTLEDSIFDDIQSVFRGGGITNAKIRGATLMILNSSFINTKAQSGSAIYFISGDTSEIDERLTGSSLYINSSFFQKCRSTENAGGAIYHVSGSGKIAVYNSTFDSNSAMVRGGAIYTDYFEDPDFFNTTMANNKFIDNFINLTNQTNDIGGDLVDMDLTLRGNLSMMSMTKENGKIIIYNASVSSFQNLALTFKLLDTFRQPYFDPDSHKILFLNISGSDYSTIQCDNYSCTIQDSKLHLLGESGGEIWMDIIYKNMKKQIPVNLRNCTQGEYYSALSCISCAPGTYSIDPFQGTCYDCPDNAVCEEGLIVGIKTGYWRGLDETYIRADGTPAPYKANLHRCDPHVNSCLRDNLCFTGYTGPLCAQCDFEKGYVPRGKKCGECADVGSLILQLLGFMLVFLGYQFWFIRNMIKTNQTFYEAIKRGSNYVSSAGPYIRLLTTFSQIMTIVSTFNLNLQEFFQIDFSLGSPQATIIYPTTCLLSRMGLPATQVYYWELSIIVLLPVVQWAVFALVAMGILRTQRDSHELSNVIFATLVGLIMLEQPGIFQSLLKAFSTKKLDPNSDLYYLSTNPSVPADEYYDQYVNYFLIPNLIVWGPGLAIALAFILLRYRKSFNSERMRLILGGYINEYREETFYWGLVLMCFKLVLMTVANFLSNDQKSKVLITVALFYLYKRALMRFNPYYEENLLNSEKYAQYAYFGSIFFLYLFEDNPYPWLKYFCLVVSIILNLFVITYIIFHIWTVSKRKVEKGFLVVAGAIRRMATSVTRKSIKRTLTTTSSNFSEEVSSHTHSISSRAVYPIRTEEESKTEETWGSRPNSYANHVFLRPDSDMHEHPELETLPSKKNTMIEMMDK